MTALIILKIIFSILFITLVFKLTLYYIPFYFDYLFNKTNSWNKKIEKPRIAILTICLVSFFTSTYLIINTSEIKLTFLNIFYLIIKLSTFLSLFCFILFILMNDKKFIVFKNKTNNTPLPSTPKKRTKSIFTGIRNKKDYFKIDKIYDLLIDNDLINFDLTSKIDFKNVLIKHNSDGKIYLQMDNPTARDFFEFLKDIFPDIKKDTNTSFFDNYRKIYRSNKGEIKMYDAKIINNSKTRTPKSKYHELFKQISKELNSQ
ncbi:hypothetical protein LNI88_06470 [Tenacibaculum dicentrarchi]|nr:hypothetical protein [Tenacibaculum dicentrarchi]MCD8424715.1 hypothetical protein [Tenacibaculum dicentrarchi]MCD8442241.1 hypothetical protein [Tenacibaculum dicentrarchi]